MNLVDRVVIKSNSKYWWFSALRHEFGDSPIDTPPAYGEGDLFLDNIDGIEALISNEIVVWGEFEDMLAERKCVGYVPVASLRWKRTQTTVFIVVLLFLQQPPIKKLILLPSLTGSKVVSRLKQIQRTIRYQSELQSEVLVCNFSLCKPIASCEYSLLSKCRDKQRITMWLNLMGGNCARPKISRNYSCAPVTMMMTDALSRRIMDSLDTPAGQVNVCDGYKGGKTHTSVCRTLSAVVELDAVKEAHYARTKPLADYLVSREPSFFKYSVNVSDLVHAMDLTTKYMKDTLLLQDCDIALAVGSMASALYEDVEWCMSEPLPLETAYIKELTVDIDQVTKFVNQVYLFFYPILLLFTLWNRLLYMFTSGMSVLCWRSLLDKKKPPCIVIFLLIYIKRSLRM